MYQGTQVILQRPVKADGEQEDRENTGMMTLKNGQDLIVFADLFGSRC